MAVRKGLWLPSTSYLPEDDRIGLSSLWYPSGSATNFLSVRAGVIPRFLQSGVGPLQVTNSSGLISNVAPGQLVYPGANNATQGAYVVTNDATVALTHAARDATNSRIDCVYIQVTDTSEGDSTNNTVCAIAQGTPSGSPAVPAIPTGAYKLAEVTVPPGAAALTYTDKRTFTSPLGTPALIANPAALPSNPYDGQEAYLLDTHNPALSRNGAWASPGIPTFPTAASRDALITAPADGQHAYRTDIHALQSYHGGVSAYVVPGKTLIASQTLGADTATVSFTSIPADFTHLRVEILARVTTAASTFDTGTYQLNGDTASHYYWSYFTVSGPGSTAASAATNDSVGRYAILPAATEAANLFGHAVIDFPYYTDATTVSKHSFSTSFSPANPICLYNSQWTPTSPAAITSIAFKVFNANNYKTGTIFRLYGLS